MAARSSRTAAASAASALHSDSSLSNRQCSKGSLRGSEADGEQVAETAASGMVCGDDKQNSVLMEQSAPVTIHSGRDGRLVRKNQFDLVRSNGTTVAGQYCVVNVLKTPPDGASRAAFSISRRYSKLAVERNRARRLFREVYSRMSSELTGFWVVFIPRHRMKTAKMDDVLNDARSCVGRIIAEWMNG